MVLRQEMFYSSLDFYLNMDISPPNLQLIENSVCLLRNLSYQVHREIPGCERYQEAVPLNQGPPPSSQKGGCFSSRKSKGLLQEVRNMHFAVVQSAGGRCVIL